MEDPPYIAELRRTLIDFPKKCNYQLNEAAKSNLRKALFRALTCDGKYLDWFFPALIAKTHDINEVHRTLQEEADWSFSKYDGIIARERDPNAHSNHPYHSNSPCARIFRKGEPIYKCLTCGFDDTCALCSYCYQPEEHEGHAVHIMICQRENAGVCDCGDPEAWVNEFHCKYAVEDESYASFKSRVVPDDFKESFTLLVGLLLDYVIDVMCHSDLHFQSPWDVATYPDKYSSNSRLDPQKYGYGEVNDADYDEASEKYCLIAYNDQIRHFRDAVQRIHLASRKVPEFATMVAEKIQNHGKATVIKSKDVALLFERQKILSSTGLASCIRNARDEVREDMCHEILLFLANLTEREAFKSNDDLKDFFCFAFLCRWQPGLLSTDSNLPQEYFRGKLSSSYEIPNLPCIDNQNNSHWKFHPSLWETDDTRSRECDYNQSIDDYEASSFRGSRFQYMVYLDIRFWKSIRTSLHDFYSTSLITNLRYKKLFSSQYIDIYPSIADMFLTIDNEPEVNILFPLSSQLFTCPSNSNSIIVHGDVSRVFVTIFNFLKTGSVKSLPSSPSDFNKISMMSLKNRRWGQIFFDIGYIVSRGKDKELIMTNSIIPMACDILSLFQGKPTMKREKDTHVEYENSDYTAFFHAVSVIYQFADYISQSTTNLERGIRQSVSKSAISHVAKFLLSLEILEGGTPVEQNDVDYGLTEDSFSEKCMMGGEKKSFLHPVHSFISWLIQYSDLQSADDLKNLLHETLTDFVQQNPGFDDVDSCLSTIFHYPLQTAVLSSQVKSGFWVRNGFSVRSQLQLYRNTNLREHGYLRDMFMIQIYNLCSEPETVMKDILKKWLLFDNWISTTSITDTSYEKTILPYIIEESASFFIHLLTEDMFLKGDSVEEITYLKIKSEIIHNLCFGPLSYSKLCSQIPEHICLEKKFDLILESLTVVKSPKGPRETSMYFLKEEYLDEINPYYFIYTTNKKEDAIKFNKERIHKKTNQKICDAVIKPKERNANDFGIYKFIGNFTTSALFRDYLIKNLVFISQGENDNTDGLLDTTLHLIHICALEELINRDKYGSFFQRFCQSSPAFGVSLATSMSFILSDEKFKKHHAKIRSIMSIFKDRYGEEFENAMQHIPNFNLQMLEVAVEKVVCESEEDRKKRLAKERQAKLLAKFKKQQKSFSHNHNIALECSDAEMEDPDEESGWKFPEPHCILCQDTASSAGPFGIITHVSKSSEFRDVPFDDRYWFLKAFSDNSNLNESEEHSSIKETYSEKWSSFMSCVRKNNVVGPGFSDQRHVHSKLVSSTCGHGMHFNCYMQYLASNKLRQNQITRNTPESIEHREFLCPLCKSINNMFIPILWNANDRSMNKFLAPGNTDTNPFDALNIKSLRDEHWFEQFREASTRDLEEFSILTTSARDMIGSDSNSLVTENQRQFRLLLTNMFQTTSLLTFPQILKADSPDTLVNSIKSLEISVRGIQSSSNLVIHHISNNSLINVRALNEFRVTSLLMKTTSWVQSPTSHPDSHIKILAHLQALSPEYFNNTIINSDFLKVLVDVFPFPSTSFDFNSVLRNCFLGCLIQNFHIIVTNLVSHNYYVTKRYTVLDIPYPETISDSDGKLAARIFKKLRCCIPQITSHEFITEDPKFGKVMFSMLVKSLTPFLRQAALYAYICCANTDEMDSTYSEAISLEANLLCAFLKIPFLSEFMENILDDGRKKTWESSRFDAFTTFIQSSKSVSEDISFKRSMEYPGLVRTIDLPDRLDLFFTDYYYSDKHQSPYLTIDNPAVCLFCSAVMDAQKAAIGSSSGQCTTHFTKECISSIGIFLLPKERCLLLLHKNGGTFYDAPYIDQHGEIPSDNKKGKAVHLSKAKYDDFIREVWLQHNVPNVIVRRLESVIDAGGWNTL